MANPPAGETPLQRGRRLDRVAAIPALLEAYDARFKVGNETIAQRKGKGRDTSEAFFRLADERSSTFEYRTGSGHRLQVRYSLDDNNNPIARVYARDASGREIVAQYEVDRSTLGRFPIHIGNPIIYRPGTNLENPRVSDIWQNPPAGHTALLESVVSVFNANNTGNRMMRIDGQGNIRIGTAEISDTPPIAQAAPPRPSPRPPV